MGISQFVQFDEGLKTEDEMILNFIIDNCYETYSVGWLLIEIQNLFRGTRFFHYIYFTWKSDKAFTEAEADYPALLFCCFIWFARYCDDIPIFRYVINVGY